MKSNAERQIMFQARRKAKLADAGRMAAALEEIEIKLAPNEKPLAITIRGIALRGLGR